MRYKAAPDWDPMRYKHARELLAAIQWELDTGEGAAGFDWNRALAAAEKLVKLFTPRSE